MKEVCARNVESGENHDDVASTGSEVANDGNGSFVMEEAGDPELEPSQDDIQSSMDEKQYVTGRKAAVHDNLLLNGLGSSSEIMSEVETYGSQQSSSSSSSSSVVNKNIIGRGLSSGRHQDTSTSTDHKSTTDYVYHSKTIAKQLEVQVSKLDELLALKESEWTTILRLKKHAEYALEQVKCAQRQALVKGQHEMNVNEPISMTEDDVESLISNMIIPSTGALTKAKRPIESSIEEAEKDRSVLEAIFPFGPSSPGTTKLSSSINQKLGSSEKTDKFVNANAFKMLCEKKRNTTDGKPADVPSNKRLRSNESVSSTKSKGETATGSSRTRRRGTSMMDLHAIQQSRRNLGAHNIEGRAKMKMLFKKLQMTVHRDWECHKMIEALMAKSKNLLCSETCDTSKPGQPVNVQTLSLNNQQNGDRRRRRPIVSSSSNALLSPQTSSPISRRMKYVKSPDTDLSLLQAPTCQGCNEVPAKFVCSSCHGQWYCSRECQVAAWPNHMNECPV